MNLPEIIFDKKCFCFTGTFEITQKDLAKEVKARNGQIADRITSDVDYLIIGAISNPAWKFGNYGNKISAALKLRTKFNKPIIIQEHDFMDALSLNFPVIGAGELIKYFFIRYECLDIREDINYLNSCFKEIADSGGLALEIEKFDYNEFFIFHNNYEEYEGNVFEYRYTLIKKLNKDFDLREHKQYINEVISKVVLFPENLSIREINEGTAAFRRYYSKYEIA